MIRHKLLTKGKNKRHDGFSRWLDRNEHIWNTRSSYNICIVCRKKYANLECPICHTKNISVASYWKMPKANNNRKWRLFIQLLKVKRGIIIF